MWYNVNRRESEQLTSQFSYISIFLHTSRINLPYNWKDTGHYRPFII